MKAIKEISILGVGNNTIAYIDIIESCGYKVSGLYHYNADKVGEAYHDKQVVGTHNDLLENRDLSDMAFAISIGDNKLRYNISNEIRLRGGQIPTLIHPTASVSSYAKIESSVIIQAHSVVQGNTIVCKDTVISYHVGVTHGSIIKNGCYIASGAKIGANIYLDDFVFIGINASLVSNKINKTKRN